MNQELSRHQKRFVIRSLLAFALVLIFCVIGVRYFAPAIFKPAPPTLAEPVDYNRLNAMIEESEHEGLEIYRWREGGNEAQVPLERAFEILQEHPEGLSR